MAGIWAMVLNMFGTTPRCFSSASYMAAISGATASLSNIGMRPWLSFPPALEGITQRQLDQTRCTHRRRDLRKVRIINVLLRKCRTGEIRVVPDVEEVGREPQRLSLGDGEVLNQREVPVLLMWAPVQVTSQRSKRRGASSTRGVTGTTGGIGERRIHKRCWIKVLIKAMVYVTRCISRGNRSPRSQRRTQGGKRQTISNIGGARSSVENRERSTRLHRSNTADCPVT